MSRHARCASVFVLLAAGIASAAARIHTVGFGKWTTVSWSPGVGADDKAVPIKVRPLIVDGRIREFVLGAPHEVTDRLFVVRRVFRVNDGLPEDSAPRWQWQRGGWLIVDRVTGHVSTVNLPEFDSFYSAVSWYRDYAAYCGVSDDGKKTLAVVAQLNRRKAVLKKPLGDGPGENAGADSACATPAWERTPTRVSFEAGGTKQTFVVRGHVVDVVNDEDDGDE